MLHGLRGRGRENSLLRKAAKRSDGRFVVVCGIGGVGKSTLARHLSRWAARRRPRLRTWWISARSPETFAGGLTDLAGALGATPAQAQAIRAGDHDVLWDLLGRERRRWLLVVDGADELGVLGPLDGTAWIRPGTRGLVLITSRIANARVWGERATLLELGPLPLGDAVKMVRELENKADPREVGALAQRLGRQPLALRLAGANFEIFRYALPSLGDGAVSAVGLSLRALTRSGQHAARNLLCLLACYAPGLPVPVSLLEAGRPDTLHIGLDLLARLGLVDRGPGDPDHHVSLHPVVAEVCRGHLWRGGAVERRAIHRTAVELITGALRDGAPPDPLAPHVRQLLVTAAPYLHGEHVSQLLHAAAHFTAHPGLLAERALAIGRAGRWSLAVTELAGLASGDHPAEPAQRLDVLHKLAWATGKAGDWRAAHALLADVVDRRLRLLGGDHPDTLRTRACLAWATWRIGDAKVAEEMHRQVIEARAGVLGEFHPETIHARYSLAEGYVLDKRFPEAETLLRAVVADRQRVHGDQHPETLDSRPTFWLGRALRGQGRHGEADQILSELLARQVAALGAGHPATLETAAWRKAHPDP